MSKRIELLAMTARIAAGVARERLTDVRPMDIRKVPPSPAHLTESWLTSALCDGVAGAEVVGYDLGPRSDGTSARRALRVSYNEAGREAGLPEFLFTKSAPTFMTRLLSAGARLAQIEATFYERIRPSLEIETPEAWYSAFDPVSWRHLLVVEDISVTRDAHFSSIVERVLTHEQAEQIVDTLATLHAKFWGAPIGRWFGATIPTAYDWMDDLGATMDAPGMCRNGFKRGRAVIPADVYARREEFHAALMRSLQINVKGPQTLLHGDTHPGNWYVTGDGRMGLYDWQCMVHGGWARDLAYALSTHLTVEQRRGWERELVARHGERLAEAGVERPDPEAAFLAYRQQMLHAMFMWIGTIGHQWYQPVMQPPDITLESVRRTSQAAADLDSFDALDQRTPALAASA